MIWGDRICTVMNLTDLIRAVRQRVDAENSLFFTDTELTDYINWAVEDVYDLLLQSDTECSHLVVTASLYGPNTQLPSAGTAAGTPVPLTTGSQYGSDMSGSVTYGTYRLQFPDMRTLKRVEWAPATRVGQGPTALYTVGEQTPDCFIPAAPVELINTLTDWSVQHWHRDTVRYLLRTDPTGRPQKELWMFPITSDTYAVRVYYIPTAKRLIAGADENPYGWDQLIICQAAIRCCEKQMRPTDDLRADAQRLTTRLQRTVDVSDRGRVKRVPDPGRSAWGRYSQSSVGRRY